MEDILASIRKILNEEEAAPVAETPVAEARTAPPAPLAPVPAASAVPPAPVAAVPAEPEPLELTEAMLVAPPPEPAPPPPRPVEPALPPPRAEPPVMASSVADEGLVAPATAAAAAAILGQLARTVAAERATPVHRGGPSIEDVVREEVRPLLKAWMDAHLPALMERLVRAEIERVVSRSLG